MIQIKKDLKLEKVKYNISELQHALVHVGTPCILVNDLLSDYFLFRRGKLPFWELYTIMQQWVTLFMFAKRWQTKIKNWKFLYASLQVDDRIGGLIKNFSAETNNYYVVGKWFPGTLLGLSKLTDVMSPGPLLRRRDRSWAKKQHIFITGPWDILISVNIEQNTAAWTELSSFDALTILIAASTNNPRLGHIILPGNANFINCLLFYFKFLNSVFHKHQFKFFLNKSKSISAKKSFKNATKKYSSFKKKTLA